MFGWWTSVQNGLGGLRRGLFSAKVGPGLLVSRFMIYSTRCYVEDMRSV
jgi:hypothetical protein